ncbi:MAG: hypothetical protein A2782_03340 [Candidatus Blackburnbacteria bacterium RIFCSPHIGHO2_01_FULL_43_15b]|uniref:YfhO family protein n=1 Tax=Candidatus Blackburnbacteria bacterium RIFCSPHIGHO2_01_FULL_43_15b TaxID=1797513 RepID=A0A1G1V2C8_9BACT|nr:MAG: hypothetical protein A2782_03340 [Candidatus Blackburnbacteria bacterium RIFCSPHIGHO2_01_FULL_43_15b]
MRRKVSDNFYLLVVVYVVFLLVSLLFLSLRWLPPGYALAGHDSGLPLGAKQFLISRLYAWDDRLGFGGDNSANFGSITIHFFDWLSAIVAGTPYAGNYVSLFFWLSLIFLSSLFLAYQFKDSLGKPFIFIFPVLVSINFYIFQSIFMLERAKFGVFSATLISLAVYFRMHDKKLSVVLSALVSALAFFVFNGGGWFGITLYGGVTLILLTTLVFGVVSLSAKRTVKFIVLCGLFYVFLNAYSIFPYLKNFLVNDAVHLVPTADAENNKNWLRDISRHASYLNLFRLQGIPEWYGDVDGATKANSSHVYAQYYLDSFTSVVASFIFPLLALVGLLLAKTNKQKRILSFFGLVALIEMVFTAGSHPPLGGFYEFLMDRLPGFFLFRSAFYKFAIFYMLGMSLLVSFALSIIVEKLTTLCIGLLFPFKLRQSQVWFWARLAFFSLFIAAIVGLWLSYHWVLFGTNGIFAWNSNLSTKVEPPSYIFDFADWTRKNNVQDKRILMLPPPSKDWQNDAYDWGYWSLSPLTSSLSSARVLSNWHVLNDEEVNVINELYNFVKNKDEQNFTRLSQRLNIGYVLLRRDVLADGSWSSAEGTDGYKAAVESFANTEKLKVFGQWDLYQLKSNNPLQVYTLASVNSIPDNLITLANGFFPSGHAVGLSAAKAYKGVEQLSANKIDAFDCLSCLLEKQTLLKSLPETNILPNSPLYYFKFMKEQKVLRESKESRSKIGNYLGLILKRTAELKAMLDTSASESFVMVNVSVVRSYLDQLYDTISVNKSNAYDYELLRQVLDFLNPVEHEVGDFSKGNMAKTHSYRFNEEMLGILWDIHKIKDFFNPLLENSRNWPQEKVYKISFPQAGLYTLYFSSQAFPRNLEGGGILPKAIRLKEKDGEKELPIGGQNNDWISLSMGQQDVGEVELKLEFPSLPNLFSIEGERIEQFPFGRNACYRGKIQGFDKERLYEVLISKTDRTKAVKVIFRDDNRVYSSRYGFLQGEDRFEVPAVAKGEFSRYIYKPAVFAKDISLYICSDDVIPPVIDKIIVQEFFTPSAINVRQSDLKIQTPPDIHYVRISPTEYSVVAERTGNPYILVFNEKFNSSWQLLAQDPTGKLKPLKKHFSVDGYANAWLVDQPNINDFKIEYAPQRLFYIGALVSAITLLSSIVWLIYSGIKTRR